jgi:hypothetical protein
MHSSQEATAETDHQASQVMPKLKQAHVESQHQIDTLSNMVEQLLVEQKNLKSKIT